MIVKNKVKLKDKRVALTVVPQDAEDLWYIYNLVAKGDTVVASTHRMVKKGDKGKAKVEKMALTLKLQVEDVDYVSSADDMRISGKSIEPNENVPLNSYHTIDVELGANLTIIKDSWDEYDMTILNDLSNIESKADVGAVVLQEGVAHICFITDSMTVLKAKVEKSIPRKSTQYGSKDHDQAVDKFLTNTLQTMLRHFDFDRLKVIMFVSPGFVAKSLYDKLFTSAQAGVSSGGPEKKMFESVLKNKSKVIIAHSSTGYLQGLEEALTDPAVKKQLAETKFAAESDVLHQFETALNDDDGRAWYGRAEVEKALDIDAVRYLMVSDSLFRSDDIQERRHYIDLTERAKALGAEVLIFSSLHDSGVQLNQLTGIAALLKYPVPDLDDDLEEDDDDDE
ncbi:hypothetical protein DIURU_000017 [Diutina rugosa]|uniref:Protein DOM34 homolog n=1 Tax=Diutina rugosa TaxID=5481 RepID=A0A642UZW6_DIURU|nr:uncharacterized protein DIURU_000017 [Diutina rugosa]KAA8908704.1 hypothetical protein DIURU_000017 [Diutina rugosa]